MTSLPESSCLLRGQQFIKTMGSVFRNYFPQFHVSLSNYIGQHVILRCITVTIGTFKEFLNTIQIFSFESSTPNFNFKVN